MTAYSALWRANSSATVISALSDKIAVRHDGNDARRPSFSISQVGMDAESGVAGAKTMSQSGASLSLLPLTLIPRGALAATLAWAYIPGSERNFEDV